MQGSKPSSRNWLHALGIIILAAGLALAYLVKNAADAAAPHYRIIGGQAYLIAADDTKQDADAIQRFGGTPGMIVAAYKHRLHDLLHSEKLAYALAIIAVLAAGRCFWIARNEPGQD